MRFKDMWREYIIKNNNMENKFEGISSLDELIETIGVAEDGSRFAAVGNPDEFKKRLEMFTKMLEEEFPDFTIEEIIKIHKNFSIFKAIHKWCGVDYLMDAIEFLNQKQ